MPFLDFVSKKSRRIVRSFTGDELYAFTNGYNAAIVTARDLRRATGQKIPIVLLTDSKQFLDIITRRKRPTERRLSIDAAVARDAFRRFDIERVGLFCGIHKPFDAMSKERHLGMLHQMLKINGDDTPVQEWIVRTKQEDHPIIPSQCIAPHSNDFKKVGMLQHKPH